MIMIDNIEGNTMEEQIRCDVANYFHISIEQIKKVNDLIFELKVNSLDIIKLIVFLEDKYGIRYSMMRYNNLTTISSIVEETNILLQK